MMPAKWLRTIGIVAAALALLILGASILLRLTTVFAVDGHAISTLAPAVEIAIRLLHRVAASSVGLLVILAVILCWFGRPQLDKTTMTVVIWMLGATIVLAVVGPLTPGYRFLSVTIINVVGGMVLLMSCWWLSESLSAGLAQQSGRNSLVIAALIVLLVHIGSGAAASAQAMHGVHSITFIHLGSAILTTMFVGAMLWAQRGQRRVSRLFVMMALLLVAQVALGLALKSIGEMPVWLKFVHAMFTPLLAIGLVSIAVRCAEEKHDHEKSPR